MLYHAYQAHTDLSSPLRLMAQAQAANIGWTRTQGSPARKWAAACEVMSRMRLSHTRPAYGIDSALVEGRPEPVVEETVLELPFGSLLRFRKPQVTGLQPLLLVAPLSGHFATLLRETLRTLLQDHEVYITDWHNARDVSLRHGVFGFDDYVEYLIRFAERIGPGLHIVAVCQPCVAALAAAALLHEDEHPARPRSLTLMAGPVDCRVNPTGVNQLATSQPIEWFERNLISHVPPLHKGHMRRVYPGFVQLGAFLSMNMDRHRKAFQDLYAALVNGDTARADVIRTFYDEYLAVNDLPAEFYLETVEKVFQTYELARGELHFKGRRVNLAAIRRMSLMTIEGERDDICSVGQTVAAQDLCTGIRPYLKTHHVQTSVGHYGVFSGRKWNQEIYPRLRDMVHTAPE